MRSHSPRLFQTVLAAACLSLSTLAALPPALPAAPAPAAASEVAPGTPAASSERPAAVAPLSGSAASFAAWLETAEPQVVLPWLAPADRRATWERLRRFYARRAHEPAWTASKRLARRLVRALEGLPGHGLDPAAYGTAELAALTPRAGRLEGAARWQAEARMSAAFLAAADHLLDGRVDAAAVQRKWHVEPRRRDLVELLSAAVAEGDVAGALRDVAPRHAGYRALASVLPRYREIVARGGWARVPEGPVLAEGEAADPARLAALASRLAAEGDLAGGLATGATYDARLAEAVRRFQARHGLEVDGKVGPATLAALNVPAAERVRQIELNLERWRWVPDELGERHVLVDLAGQELVAVEGGREALRMRVVVGRASWQTPIFTAGIEYVVLNPFWNIPRSIARAEILPGLREDPSYLDRRDMELLSESGVIDLAALDPAAIEAGRQRFRQRPGPGNSLGSVKLMFPNRFNVYLHDTPSDHEFERADRRLSHSCVRLERPEELTAFVLEGVPEWDRERVAEAFDSGRTKRVDLPEPLPVHLFYWTAKVEDGVVHFHRDGYAQDPPLDRALARVAGGNGEGGAGSGATG